MKLLSTLALLGVMLPAAATAQDWQATKSAEGNFSASFPAEAQYTSQELKTDIGAIRLHMYQATDPVSKSFMAVVYSDYPQALLQQKNIKQMLDDARDGAVNNVNGKLTSEQNIQVAGFPGRELLVDVGPQLEIRQRMWVVKNRLYQQIVVYPKAAPPAKTINTFVTSFAFLQNPR